MDCMNSVPKEKTAHLNELTLEECFKIIEDGNVLELDMDNLNKILERDLEVNLYILKPKLKSIIPYMLVHFMKSWPSWQKVNIAKQIVLENWFPRFKEYLVLKINNLITNDFEKVSEQPNPIDESILFKIDNSSQTVPSPLVEKSQAPYSIEIQGFPKMLNSLVFCEGANDDIIIKEYRTAPFEEDLTTKQLINWPFIEVEFKSKELHFMRQNMHEYKKYIMFRSERIIFKKADALIEEVDIINEQITRVAFTLNVIKEYCNLYINVINKHQLVLGMTKRQIEEISTTLQDFVSDIAEINMNSIATNTSVLFNIGGCIYPRNKIVRTSDQAVCFAESITPKMNLSLFDFTAIKDHNSDNPFRLLHHINNTSDINLIRKILPSIKYSCKFCDKSNNSKHEILEHLKQKHCMEQPVLCFNCKLQLNICRLAEDRWKHQCNCSRNEVNFQPR